MTAPAPRGRRTAGGGLAATSFALNQAEADLLKTELEMVVDSLDAVAADPANPDNRMAKFRRRQLNVLVARLDPLTLDEKDDESTSPFGS